MAMTSRRGGLAVTVDGMTRGLCAQSTTLCVRCTKANLGAHCLYNLRVCASSPRFAKLAKDQCSQALASRNGSLWFAASRAMEGGSWGVEAKIILAENPAFKIRGVGTWRKQSINSQPSRF